MATMLTVEQMTLHIRGAADAIDALDNGELARLDSLKIMDLVVELERIAGISIPTAAIDPANFTTVDALANYLVEIFE